MMKYEYLQHKQIIPLNSLFVQVDSVRTPNAPTSRMFSLS